MGIQCLTTQCKFGWQEWVELKIVMRLIKTYLKAGVIVTETYLRV